MPLSLSARRPRIGGRRTGSRNVPSRYGDLGLKGWMEDRCAIVPAQAISKLHHLLCPAQEVDSVMEALGVPPEAPLAQLPGADSPAAPLPSFDMARRSTSNVSLASAVSSSDGRQTPPLLVHQPCSSSVDGRQMQQQEPGSGLASVAGQTMGSQQNIAGESAGIAPVG